MPNYFKLINKNMRNIYINNFAPKNNEFRKNRTKTYFLFTMVVVVLFLLFSKGNTTAQTFFGVASTPADGGSQAPGTIVVTPPASMVTGDLVVIYAQLRDNVALSISATGGQSWTSETSNTPTTTLTTRVFWCRYNGTWSVSPSVTTTGSFSQTVVMFVFRPSAGTSYWGVDVAQVNSDGSTPALQTITGVTTTWTSTVTMALWASSNDNTWGTLTGSGWSKAGLTAQYRNTAGSDQSITAAYYLQNSTTSGATGNVSQTQSLTEACGRSIISWFEIKPPTISSFSPTSVCQRSNFTITGTNFQGTTSVTVNGVSASYTVNSTTQITVTCPATATTGNVIVTNAANTASSAITVLTAPTIAAAGSDITVCPAATSVPLAANTPSVGTGAWSVIGGAGTFSDGTSATSTVSSYNSGANTYRWTTTQGTCTSTDDVILTKSASCTYCASTGTLNTAGWVSNVQFNTINRPSGWDGGYYDATATSTTVTQNVSYDLKLTRWNESTYILYTAAWIDFNNNGVFTDAGENVMTSASTTTAGDLIRTVSVTIPGGSVIGSTRLRVTMRYNTAITGPCDNTTYLETEDYTVNIVAQTPCSGTPVVGNTLSTNPIPCPTNNSFTLSMDLIQVNSGITYQWQNSSDGITYSDIGGANSATLATSHTTSTYYQCKVTCTSSGLSATSSPLLLKYLATCYCTPTGNLTVSSNDYISHVDFNYITNTTTGGAGGYTKFPASDSTITLVSPGLDYTLSISVGAGTGNHTAGVWIDYDQSGTFDVAEYSLISSTISPSTTVGISINIPLTAISGTTLMRIRYFYLTAMSSTVQCTSTGTFGETEDYYVTICPVPTVVSPSTFSTCSGGSTTLSASTGYTTIQWQSSTDNVTFTNITGATASTYATPALTSTIYYRALTSPSCMGYSNTVTVSVAPSVTGQPVNASACPATNTSFSVVTGSSTSTYQWQLSTNSGASWADITAAGSDPIYSTWTTATLNLTAVVVGNNGYQYRCRVGDCSTTINSAAGTLSVAAASGGTVTPASSSGACSGTGVGPITLTNSGYTGGIQWQSSPDNSTWSDIYGQTSATYAATASSTTYYRTVQTVSGCVSANSTTATITVTGLTNATWTGTTSSDWVIGTNWSTGSAPTSCTNVTINSGGTQPVVTLTGAEEVHNLTVNPGATLTITTSKNKYLKIWGNLKNDGIITQSSLSTALTTGPNAGKCNSCSGLSFCAVYGLWTGSGTYPQITTHIEDGSNTTIASGSPSIHYLDCSKTVAIGTLNLGAQTLSVTGIITQSGSVIRFNKGMLWNQITQTMLFDPNLIFPEMGTYYRDYAGNWNIGDWTSIGGGTGYYNLWERATGGVLNHSGANHCRGNFVIKAPGVGGSVAFTASGNYKNTIEGDFINEGTFNHNALNEIVMDGPGLVYNSNTNTFVTSTVPQNITGPSTTTFTELTINNSTTGVQLNGIDATVSSILTLTAGPLYLNSKQLTVTNSATTAITRTSGYVVSETPTNPNPSKLQWNIGATTGAHIFPFGVDGSYIPVTFNNSVAAGNVIISTRATAGSDNAPWSSSGANAMFPDIEPTNSEGKCLIDRWWDISANGGVTLTAPGADVTFTYRGSENTLQSSSPNYQTGLLLSGAHWNSGPLDWNDGKGGAMGTYNATTAYGATATTNSVTVNDYTEFASPDVLVAGGVPLPVGLLTFDAYSDNGIVNIEWSTASEKDNSFFTVERSIDATDFTKVVDVPSNAKGGNSMDLQKYSTKDLNPYHGVSYYRLKQTNLDGTFKDSWTVTVNVEENEKSLVLFPNPTRDEIDVYIPFQNATLIIYDVRGMVKYKKQYLGNAIGVNNTKIDVSGLPDGAYFININNGRKILRSTFVKE